jgi:protein-disulfide isomerase
MVNLLLSGSKKAAWATGAALGLGLACAAYAANTADSPINPNVIGIIGQERLAEPDVIASDKSEFDQLQGDYALKRRELELKYAQMRHDLVQRQLDRRLDRAALEMEAKARGIATDEVLAGLKSAAPTDDEVRAFYEAHADRIKQPYEEVASKARQYLANQRNQEATRSFYDDLRAKYGISSLLPPYRVSVAAMGPARGENTAPVTIVEFGDFECPYCKAAESSLRRVMARYPREVRVVFRNLPLTQIHPNAQIAAEAAICADRQGKFWEMHDAMYGDQSALNLDALKNAATRLGLDTDRFSACLADGSTRQSLDLDAKAARELGLSGTPYFFVNGRPIDGDVPVEKFENLIQDELHRAHDRS